MSSHLGDRDAAQEELQLLRHVAGGQTDALQPVLIEREAKRGHALAPIGVGRSHQGAGLHHSMHLRGNVTKLVRVRAPHTERNRKGRVRAEHKLGNSHTRLRRQAIGHHLSQSELERLARLFAPSQYDDFRERGIG